MEDNIMRNFDYATDNFASKTVHHNLTFYKKQKLKLLREFGIYNVSLSVFDKATNEIQVDNITHSLIMG